MKTDKLFYRLFHVQPDKTFYARWLASIFICLHQERITTWRGLVLFPNRSLDVGDTAPYAPLLEQGLIQRVYPERRSVPCSIFPIPI